MSRRILNLLLIALLVAATPAAHAGQSGRVLSGKDRSARTGRDTNERSGASGAPRSSESARSLPDQRRLREIETLEHQCLDEVNHVRERSGLKPLDFDEELLDVARDYSRRMAEEHFFSHIDPDGHNVKQRIERASIPWKMVGENLAYSNGYVNPVAASLRGWMDSPGHRANILDRDYSRTAVGVWIGGNGTVYFTEIFLKR
ncbi:MAG TPA: CAP domain-containing protein [Blastocatellia bacterium]|nr:CAP domain-containing protein [Blastocatellia bacterium]